ncbi:hypothetical protein B0H14DRAFT_1150115 [Mycena olivaceomarginata]|nr:hypothetical protein B0H14DRAFT_1150115 [Mycena olivaceomarginata]
MLCRALRAGLAGARLSTAIYMRVGLPRERADGHYARARADGAADAAAAPTAGERRAPAARHPLLNLRTSRSWRQCQCGPLSARRRGMRVHSHSQTRRLVGGSCWGVAAPSRKFLQSGAEELLAILGRWHTRISATRHSTASADRMYFITSTKNGVVEGGEALQRR